MRNCVNGSKPCSTAGSRYNYKCCLHSAAAHLLLKHWCWEVYGARCEKGELCPGRRSRGKQSIWTAFYSQSGIMGQRRRSLWELRLWVLTGLGPVWLHQQTLLFIDFIIRASKMQRYTGTLLASYILKRWYLDGNKYHRNIFFLSSSQCYIQSFWALFDSRLIFLLSYCIIIIITEEDISLCSLWLKAKQSVSIFSEWQQIHLCPVLQVKQRPHSQNLICPDRTREVLDSMRVWSWWLTFKWTADSRSNWTVLLPSLKKKKPNFILQPLQQRKPNT